MGAEFEPLIAHNGKMFNITFSNKYQSLLENLLEATAQPPASPFAAQQIIVPSAAIRRNLELAIANRFGICANVQFSFLGMWVWRQIAKVSAVQETSPFSPPVLAWRIHRILDDIAFVQRYARLATYLGKADAVMRFDLASQVAAQFEQMMTYRPDWIETWSDGKLLTLPDADESARQDQQWQAALWRRIAQEVGNQEHLSAALHMLEALDVKNASKLDAGGTVHLFCLSTIAPLYIDILNQLGKWIDLHLYVLNPCQEYWFDIVDPRRLSYLAATGKTEHHETGNRLLAAWGTQTKAMVDLLFEKTSLTSNENSCFMPSQSGNGNPSLLARIQDGILNLQDLPPAGISLNETDRSIEFHSCHSLSRELEVLQDQLLAMFAGSNPPQPADVLVVTPDLEQAAPLIDAIFGTARDSRRIPYTITGRGNSRTNTVAAALLNLLSIVSSRFTASAVFKLLQQPLIARRFGLNEADLKTVHGWIAESGIRWGLDAAHRRQLDLPDSERYSFRDGMHRLYLGYALPAEVQAPFNSRLPAGNPEGSGAKALGSFWHFMQQLTTVRGLLQEPKSPQGWRNALTNLCDTFMASAGNELDDWREVQSQLHELCDNMQLGCNEHPVTMDVMQSALTSLLDDPARGGVPTGTVTFTSMSSLRNLPYRIVCAIGMNDGAFPTARRPAEFDLMSLAPRRGDRQRRTDERNLFLDLLLAAQERLYLSYTGHSVRDNSAMPPSVLLSDLLDYAVAAIAGDSEAARKRLRVEHPLQPFSMEYFLPGADPRVTSSNDEYCQALKGKLANPAALNTLPPDDFDESEDEENSLEESALAFFRSPLTEPGEEWRKLSLDQLLRFFRNPSRYLLQQRLGISFPEKQEDLLDDEPFLPDWEEKNSLADRLLPLYLSEANPDNIWACALAGTEYPPGELGKALLERELQALDTFAQKLKLETATSCLPPQSRTIEFLLDGETWSLTHAFSDLRPEGLIRYRYDDARPTDYLAGWLNHLFLNAAELDGASPQTVWHSRDGKYLLNPIEDARAHLQQLLILYRNGLTKPLHFFPKSAWAYITASNDLSKAEKKWRNDWNEESGEVRDPSYRQALRGLPNLLDQDFEHCAQTVFAPLLDCIEDERLERAS